MAGGSTSGKLCLDTYGLTDRGSVREINQDAWHASAADGFAVIADGVGGNVAGELASREAVEYFSVHWKNYRSKLLAQTVRALSDPAGAVAEIIQRTHQHVAQVAGRRGCAGMATTLVSAGILRDTVVVSNVGDSRCYRIAGNTIERLSTDHTAAATYYALNGSVSPEGAPEHQNSPLIQALGLVDKPLLPNIRQCPAIPGDLYLLVTDGVSKAVNEREIVDIASSRRNDLAAIADALMSLARSRGDDDNATLVLLSVKAGIQTPRDWLVPVLAAAAVLVACLWAKAEWRMGVAHARLDATKTAALAAPVRSSTLGGARPVQCEECLAVKRLLAACNSKASLKPGSSPAAPVSRTHPVTLPYPAPLPSEPTTDIHVLPAHGPVTNPVAGSSHQAGPIESEVPAPPRMEAGKPYEPAKRRPVEAVDQYRGR